MKSFSLEAIDRAFEAEVLSLFRSCSGYFHMTEGQEAGPASVMEFFEERPPGSLPGEKHVFGVFVGNILAGVVDLVENYPQPGEWIIGLLLLHPDFRGRGLGKGVHEELVLLARAGGAGKMRIGVVEQNHEGLAFWSRLGYRETGRTLPRQTGNKKNVIIIMNLAI